MPNRNLIIEARKAQGRTQGEAESDADTLLAERQQGKDVARGVLSPSVYFALNTDDPDPDNHFWERV